jgi:DeoR family fructose operon transcriptional repressor
VAAREAYLRDAGEGTTVVNGRVRGRTLAAVDAWAVDALTRLNVDVAVVGTNGFSVERGLTTPDASEAGVKTAMVAAGRRVIALADSSKYGTDNLARFAELRDIDVLVTDDGLATEHVAAIEGQGPDVVLG